MKNSKTLFLIFSSNRFYFAVGFFRLSVTTRAAMACFCENVPFSTKMSYSRQFWFVLRVSGVQIGTGGVPPA